MKFQKRDMFNPNLSTPIMKPAFVCLMSTVAILSLAFVTRGQSTSSPKKVLGSFVYAGDAYNYEFRSTGNGTYTLNITTAFQRTNSKADSNTIETDTTKEKTAERDSSVTNEDIQYLFADFNQDVFQSVFLDQMVNMHSADRNDLKLRDKSVEVFLKVKSNYGFLEDEPVTAHLMLRKKYVTSLLKTNKSIYYNRSLSRMTVGHQVKNVVVETEDGAIKNITAHLIAPYAKVTEISPAEYVEFKNTYPISISSKFDPDRLAKINLYCFNCYGIKGLDRFIKLSDLVVLDVTLQNDKENYSPANSTVELNQDNQLVELKKEKRSRILEVSAFTDFVGLDQEEPNGLIQIEAKRRINIVTTSRQVRRFERVDDIANQLNLSDMTELKRVIKGDTVIYFLFREPIPNEVPLYSKSNIKVRDTTITVSNKGKSINVTGKLYQVPVVNKRFGSSYWTFINYIEPKLLFSKLEQNNRLIDRNTLGEEKIDPIKLYRYQLVSFGFLTNLIRVTYPQGKVTWNTLSGGLYWFRSRVGDPADVNIPSEPLNSSYYILSSEFLFRHDNRWGATLGISYLRTSLWSNNVYKLAGRNGIIQPYFDGFYKTNDTDRLFFRFRWSYEHKERDNNFTQIQLGYSINLFADNSNK